MEQPKTQNSTGEILLTQAIWATLTVAQQEMVLQTIIQICCQIVVQQKAEVRHEPDAE